MREKRPKIIFKKIAADLKAKSMDRRQRIFPLVFLKTARVSFGSLIGVLISGHGNNGFLLKYE